MQLKQKINTQIQKGILAYLNFIIDICQKELRQQGHYVTGETENSFKAEVKHLGNSEFEGVILVKESAIILNYGVKAANVPYQQGSGKGKSKYIQALLDWAALVKPDLNEKERKGFVFAVARKAKKEGHPTTGSFGFSKNGRRKDWIEFAIKPNIETIFEFINVEETILFELSGLKLG